MAQKRPDSLAQYRRSSLYSVLIKHSQLPYGESIDSAFMAMPMPEKFNNHNLDIRSFESSAKKVKVKANSDKKDAVNLSDINNFIAENGIAKNMVAKWFNRNAETGVCNLNLIGERGLYDASQLDIAIADQTIMGREQLADQGEELINNTYLLVNDITFADKGERSEKGATAVRVLGGLFSAFTGVDVTDATNLVADGVNEIDGFTVNITSYLFRLKWDEERLKQFYDNYYVSARHDADKREARRAAFDAVSGADTTLFKLEYVGRTITSASKTTSKSFAKKSKAEQMITLCARAVDKSIVELQREYEDFKVNVPIYRVNEDGTVDVQIGLKEGVNSKSVYEVLMPTIDENGNSSFKKIGTLSPVEGKIWDNRFGALEEATELEQELKENPKSKAKADESAEEGNVHLDATTFKANPTSNADNFIGCVVREAKIKTEKKKK